MTFQPLTVYISPKLLPDSGHGILEFNFPLQLFILALDFLFYFNILPFWNQNFYPTPLYTGSIQFSLSFTGPHS